ncbi:MAG: ABC transporter substrate-binding protein [Deltaproteobacteria bacterium]|nr:ABC transporter substrate-binding protein [Deltaproteobacteria bacterium]
MNMLIVSRRSLIFLVLIYAWPAYGQAPLEKLRLAYSAIGGSQASFWIPYEAEIFRKHGLDVELLYVAGGGRAAQVVQSGEVPIGLFTGGAVINSNLAGGDLVAIASSMNVMTFAVMARPEIKRVEDLKGKKVGISRFGSATDFGLRYAEDQWPVKRQRDFAVIQMGGVSDVYGALRAGALDAGVINAELAILARREGYRELIDIAKMGINFPTSSVVTTRSYIKRNENTLRKFVRGFVEGVHFGKTQRAPTISIMKKYLRSSDAAMFDELYEMYPAFAGGAEDGAGSNSGDRPAGGQSQARAIYRRALLSGIGKRRLHPTAVEIKRCRTRCR